MRDASALDQGWEDWCFLLRRLASVEPREPESPTEETMAFCPNCGAAADGRYCPKCGTALDAQDPAPGPIQPGSAASLPENTAAALCYVLGFVTGILFLVLAPYSRNKLITVPRLSIHFSECGCVPHYVGSWIRPHLVRLAADFGRESGLLCLVGLHDHPDLSGQEDRAAGYRRLGGAAGLGAMARAAAF
jgi:hypothetical protein